MNKKKKIVFLSGTRADFGKIKSLLKSLDESKLFNLDLFVTGMHLDHKYGYTVDEIRNSGFKSVEIHEFENHSDTSSMDEVLAKTIFGFSKYIRKHKPDLVIVHGDRGEALAGSIAGSFNNVLVGHIEGGEISGTIDELIRHSVTKMSHIHFVSNEKAKHRLIQMGEIEESIHVIGSPDIDIMISDKLPTLDKVKERYDINFEEYGIAMLHPVTTEFNDTKQTAKNFFNALIKFSKNFVVIYPNNDYGHEIILDEISKLHGNKNFLVFPSLRFEYFLTLLKHADLIAGNSSAGIKEAPFYGTPTLDVGTRQNNRGNSTSILNVHNDINSIYKGLENIFNDKKFKNLKSDISYGEGKSDKLFLEILISKEIFQTPHQKQFQELK